MDDETLVAAYYACDNNQLAALRMRHHGNLVAFFGNGGAGDEAEDCAQEVWVRVTNTKMHIGSTAQPFDPARGVPLLGWLFAIARGILIDALRRRGRTPGLLPLGGEESLEYEIPSRDDPVEAELVNQELLDAIEHCIEELPDSERIVYDLERMRGDQTPTPT